MLEPAPGLGPSGRSDGLAEEELGNTIVQEELDKSLNRLDQLDAAKRAEAEAFSAKSADIAGQDESDPVKKADLCDRISDAFDQAIASGAPPPQALGNKSRRFGAGQGGPAPLIAKTLPPLSPQALVSGTRAAERACRQPASPSPAMRKTASSGLRHDPAKIMERRPDGRMNMKGVRAQSEVSLYNNFDPYGKKAFEVRKAFKIRQARGIASPATKTWGAVNSWYASSKSFDDFIAEAKTGNQFQQHRAQNLGGQFTSTRN